MARFRPDFIVGRVVPAIVCGTSTVLFFVFVECERVCCVVFSSIQINTFRSFKAHPMHVIIAALTLARFYCLCNYLRGGLRNRKLE